jgi:hypothetical protein
VLITFSEPVASIFHGRHGLPSVRVGGWLCLLPILLRIYSLSTLLQRLNQVRGKCRRDTHDVEQVVHIVVRVCNLRPFNWQIFPRRCLRQSLSIYRTLIQFGYPAEIHFGIRKDDADLVGHSWVTMQGKTVADRAQSDLFKVVYSYPSAPFASALRFAKTRD